MTMVRHAVAALGVLGATVLTSAPPAAAQGIYFEGPGVEFGVGRPWYRDHHRYYGRPYAFDRPYRDRYWRERYAYRWSDW